MQQIYSVCLFTSVLLFLALQDKDTTIEVSQESLPDDGEVLTCAIGWGIQNHIDSGEK